MEKKKAILIIMDGWGIGAVPSADAIRNAHTPFVDSLYNSYPNTTLITYGEDVGLPAGQMGNSEVGHLNLGAGRIVYQELQRFNVAISSGELKKNPVLLNAFQEAKTTGKKLHFIGLVSDGGVHSHINHIKALCSYAEEAGVPRYAVHAFTDGRDTDPKSGFEYISDLRDHLEGTRGVIASAIGRYYAMDRDKRWDRVKKAYDLLVHGIGTPATDIPAAIKASYEEGVTDEFILPLVATDAAGAPLALIEDGDVVICFNFRTDRCREITEVLTQKAFPEFDMKPLQLHYVTATVYDQTFKNVEVLFHNDNLENTIGEVLEKNGKTQIRIAETEKYPHVTFFFSGGREKPFEGEQRIMKPSPKDVPTYDLKPEMSARDLTEAILPEIEKGEVDFICLNFANTDMVGHTGVWAAAKKAAETVDECVSKIIPVALSKGYTVFLTADHGNSDFLINEDGTPNTAHSMNPVPLFIIDNQWKGKITPGKLGDIAPTILYMLGVPVPPEMTGKILVS